jgi:hypothetical protein
MIIGERNAHATAGALAGEVGHLRRRLDHSIGARLVLRQFKPQRERILSGRLRDLVEKGFGANLL